MHSDAELCGDLHCKAIIHARPDAHRAGYRTGMLNRRNRNQQQAAILLARLRRNFTAQRLIDDPARRAFARAFRCIGSIQHPAVHPNDRQRSHFATLL